MLVYATSATPAVLAVSSTFLCTAQLPDLASADVDGVTLDLKGANIPIRLLSRAFPVDGKAVGVAWWGTR
ncbi:hypothetical protein ACFXDF_21465 [Streptomyces sp. NPDC059426]|uniref:hypothetical protein n=1 Tax=Streptomyces sp. NPDC059426 TaxID=3346827 RepID=UPI0036CD5096